MLTFSFLYSLRLLLLSDSPASLSNNGETSAFTNIAQPTSYDR